MGIRVPYNPCASECPAGKPFPSKVRTARPAALEVSAVSKRRTTSLIISLVLSFAVLVPQAALGFDEDVPAAPAVSDAAPAAPARVEEKMDAEASEDAVAASDARPVKPK